MSSHNYKFNVAMSCGGCSGAIERVLKKLDGRSATPNLPELVSLILSTQYLGVQSFDVSLEKQTAEVVSKDDSLSYDAVLSTIKKTGKKVKSGEADGKEMPIEVAAV